MSDTTGEYVRRFRFELYSHAWDVLRAGGDPAAVRQLYADAAGCRRALEAIELAEFHVAFRIPKRGIQHFVRQLARCSDCTRTDCVGVEPQRAPCA